MRLYLARHGKAELGPEDADRALSARGRDDVTAMARHLVAQQIAVGRVVHSGLARARQTADILADAVAPGVTPQHIPNIEPWGDVDAFARLVETWDDDVMVCGHEPFMGEVVSLLIGGDARAGLVVVKTGTVMALEREEGSGRWTLRWMLTPRMIRGPKTEDSI